MIPTYTMFGKQVRVFPFSPNWVRPVTESLEWKTDVFKSHSGIEQRRALRNTPRRTFEFQVLLQGDSAALLDNLLWAWTSRDLALPVWVDSAKLSSSVSQGSTSVPCSTAGRSFRIGDFALIYSGPFAYEVVQIATLSASLITTVAPLIKAWSGNILVIPLVVAHLPSSNAAVRHTGYVVSGNFMFETSPHLTWSGIVAAGPDVLYDGIEVLTVTPNWRTPIQNTFTREFDTVDSGVGPIGYLQRETVSRLVKPFQWLLKSRADIANFKAFVGRREGQLKPCWMPSHNNDMRLAQSNIADHNKIIVAGTHAHELSAIDVSRNRLMLRLPDGTTFYRRIVSTTPDYVNDQTALNLDSPIATTVGVSDNVRLQFIQRYRLASDKIVIEYVSDSIAEPLTNFTTVNL